MLEKTNNLHTYTAIYSRHNLHNFKAISSSCENIKKRTTIDEARHDKRNAFKQRAQKEKNTSALRRKRERKGRPGHLLTAGHNANGSKQCAECGLLSFPSA